MSPLAESADDLLDGLIHSVDLDGLVRLIDARCAEHDWAGIDRIRRRCTAATRETGRQLWPAATLSEYRLALHAPPEWVAMVLDGEAGRFTVGPLSEVAADRHTWAELAPHLDPSPVALYVAHERSLRGETIATDSVDRLPQVIDIPVTIQPWEPTYPLSTYSDDGGEHEEPPNTARLVTHLTTHHGEVVEDESTESAVRLLVDAWTTTSTGRAESVCVEGTHLDALGALGVSSVRVGEVPASEALALLAWAGATGAAHGRRRGMAIGRYSMWWLLGALGDLYEEWPPSSADAAELLADLTWYRWDAHEPPSGWRLQLAIENRSEGVAWAINASDDD